MPTSITVPTPAPTAWTSRLPLFVCLGAIVYALLAMVCIGSARAQDESQPAPDPLLLELLGVMADAEYIGVDIDRMFNQLPDQQPDAADNSRRTVPDGDAS